MQYKQSLLTGLYLTSLMFISNTGLLAEPAQKQGEWINLLENDLLTQWQASSKLKLRKATAIGAQWSVKDGILSLDKTKQGRGGDITTKKDYFSFELKFEFKISEGGNSGVKYRTQGSLGLEFQILDDKKAKDNKNPKNSLSSLYQLVAAPADKKFFAPNTEWNKARIVANGNTIEHWLNGQKTVSIKFGSDDWKKRFAMSKYKGFKNFAKKPGPILLQDHGDNVVYRNLMIRELK